MKNASLFWIPIMLSTLFSSCSLSPKLPSADGPHYVGYSRFVVEEADRWIDVQAFYPAIETTDIQPVALSKELANVLGPSFGVPAAAMADSRPIPAYENATRLEGAHPVVVFNHGHSSFATQNLHNLLYLASHGYIVLTLNHPSYSALSQQGDMSVPQKTLSKPEGRAQTKAILNAQAELWQSLREAPSFDDWKLEMQRYDSLSYFDIDAEFQEWVLNNELLLSTLPAINRGDIATPLKLALDLEKIGYAGHSFGGSVATHMNWQHSQVKASINLDGPVFTQSVVGQPSGAFCFAYGDAHKQLGIVSDSSWSNRQLAKVTRGCERKFISAAHMNFSDLNELAPLRWFGVLGKVEAELMRNNLNITLLDFFNQHLLGQGEMRMLAGTETVVY